MLLKYVAAVDLFARSLDDMLVPLVAVELLEHHHPVVFLKVTLVRLEQP